MYSKFIKEYDGTETIEDTTGFATYRISGDECHIAIVYVLPEYRENGVARTFSDRIEKIAREAGCKYISAGTCLDANNPSRSRKVMTNCGYFADNVNGNMIYYCKEL